MNFVQKKGKVTGRGHIVYGLNCQDALLTRSFEYNGFTYHIGAVADGCSEGMHSELGAELGVAFSVTKIEELIKGGMPVKVIPGALYVMLVEYLRQVTGPFQLLSEPYARMVSFIKEHLLFTLIGFIVGPDDTVVFAAGDGLVAINDLTDLRDQQNMPMYIAYHLVEKSYLQTKPSAMPSKFDVYELKTADLKTLAIGTDAWAQELDVLLQILSDECPANVQTLMNRLSSKEKRFQDDASIILIKGG